MANDHTLYVREGNVGTPAEPNKNPSPAQSAQVANTGSAVGSPLQTGIFLLAGKQVIDATVNNIGFATGNYELQESVQATGQAIGVAGAFLANPVVTGIALTIKTSTDIYKINKTQQRKQYAQQENQILTGNISVNKGRW